MKLYNMVYWMTKDLRINHLKGSKFFRVLISDYKVWLPVIKPNDKIGAIKPICYHTGETEAKNGGYVCLECFQFLSYAQVKKDNKIGQTFSDIN